MRRVFYQLAMTTIVVALGLSSVGAEVKLRIYLKDGSLKSGTLVTERDDAFVVLAQSGRIEVPKVDIMFVNGKTLDQWKESPDRLFQTEIIPSELPDPNFVNAKAALPPPISVQRVVPVVEPIEPVRALPKGALPEMKRTAATEAASGGSGAPVKAPMKIQPDVIALPAKNEGRVNSKSSVAADKAKDGTAVAAKKKTASRARAVAVPAKAESAAPKRASKWEPMEVAARPRRFSRDGNAHYHFARAKSYLAEGKSGRAIQELHFATLLDRRNAEAAFILGRLYMEAGLHARARSSFDHPGLKKDERIPSLLSDMDAAEQARKDHRLRMMITGSVGAFAWVPFVLFSRHLRKRRARRRVFDSSHMSEPANPIAVSPAGNAPAKTEGAAEAAAIDFERRTGFRTDSSANVRVNEAPPPAGHEPASEREPAAAMPPVMWPKGPKGEAGAPPADESKQTPPAPPPHAAHPVERPERTMEKAPEPIESSPDRPVAEPREPNVTEGAPPEPARREAEAPLVAQAKGDATTPSEDEPSLPAVPIAPPVKTSPASSSSSETERERRERAERAARLGNETLAQAHEYAAGGDWEQACRAYRTAQVIDSARPDPHLGLGYVAFMNGQWELALQHYVNALTIDPESADAHYGIGRVLVETNDEERAAEELRLSLKLDPTLSDARETLSRIGRAA